jgi:protocatechuate 3,4-dioxygenase beta subunit
MTAVFLAVGLLFALPQRDARSATASVSGSVVEAVSHAAIPNARVAIAGNGVRESTTADNDGRFTFAGLPPGSYTLTADKEGFAFDLLAPPGVIVAEGQTVMATIEMPRAAVIVGDVRDEQGNPRSGVAVHLKRKMKTGGTDGRPPAPDTNDLGEFRVDRLLPGEYLALATPPNKPASGRALMPTYYPSATDQKDALTVTVEAGATAAMSITMRSAPAHEITGAVVDEQGRPLRAMIVFVAQSVQTWAPGQSASLNASVASLITRQDGTFRIAGLGPGTYRLTPLPAPEAPPQRLPLDVVSAAVNGNRSTTRVDVRDANVSGVTIVMRQTP